MGLGKIEMALIILAIILLLFGAKNLPKLARSLGDSVKELKRGFKDDPASDKDDAVANSTERGDGARKA